MTVDVRASLANVLVPPAHKLTLSSKHDLSPPSCGSMGALISFSVRYLVHDGRECLVDPVESARRSWHLRTHLAHHCAETAKEGVIEQPLRVSPTTKWMHLLMVRHVVVFIVAAVFRLCERRHRQPAASLLRWLSQLLPHHVGGVLSIDVEDESISSLRGKEVKSLADCTVAQYPVTRSGRIGGDRVIERLGQIYNTSFVQMGQGCRHSAADSST